MIHRIINTSNAVARLYASPTTPSMMVDKMKAPCQCAKKNECHAVSIIGMKINRHLWKCNASKTQQLLWSEKHRPNDTTGVIKVSPDIDAKHRWMHLFVEPKPEPVVVATVEPKALPSLFAETKASLPSLW